MFSSTLFNSTAHAKNFRSKDKFSLANILKKFGCFQWTNYLCVCVCVFSSGLMCSLTFLVDWFLFNNHDSSVLRYHRLFW